ncbi:MAG: hypothetical protein EOP51_04010 [Sphingobacteriales bacterium]|nr:MAG: hypothetical protein EOP51_04010 [Sphingobacteriales bacterium]
MIAFLLYTIVALVANACLVKILFISIQQGQWLDNLLGWQKKLQEWDRQGKVFVVKAGGYCELCFSHAVTFICFWCYVLFMNAVLHYWLTDEVNNMIVKIVINIIWYLTYISTGTNLSLYLLNKMKKP